MAVGTLAPAWPVPPEGGWQADDLDSLPDLPEHTQLIDASLVFPCPQSVFHTRALGLIGRGLTSSAPAEVEMIQRFTIDLDAQNRPEPDVVVIRQAALEGFEQTRVAAADVVLVVEVVSPDSASRDRETKPMKYARAKIPHFWRVENERGRAVVHAFELEPTTGTYTSVGIFRDRMKAEAPFPVDLDLTGIKTRRDTAE
ncbi:Uma2 family endonuclease [Streptomyces griseoluteus]|uniref:Uma2 family endonuclease n=1 Tax=Streptomyces griseoluteus TaxID=29306 RepID=UPI0033303D1D